MGRSTRTQSSIRSEEIHSPWERFCSPSSILTRDRHYDPETTSQTTGHDWSVASSSVQGDRLTLATDFPVLDDKQDPGPEIASDHQVVGKSTNSEGCQVSPSPSPRGDVSPGTSEEDYDSYLFDSSPTTTEMPDLDPMFAEVRGDVVTEALHRFSAGLLRSSTSMKRPRRSLSPRTSKRVKLHCVSKHSEVEQRIVPEEEDTVFVDIPWTGGHAFACPFYIQNPEKHLRCLSQFDLRSIENLKRHLWNSHQRPHYCPTCGRTFDRASDCDDHIRSRICHMQDSTLPEGITEEQMHQLARRAKPGISEASQWFDIWRIVFPSEEDQSPSTPPPTPYLAGDLESVVCVARNFWRSEGQAVIAEFLEARGLRGYDVPDEERNLSALHQIVLNDLIDGLLASSRLDDGDPGSSSGNDAVPTVWTSWRYLQNLWSRR